ncbi:MAG: hypothetical protein EOP83_21445, partial [Verrucomicrobiaceae bacterium]
TQEQAARTDAASRAAYISVIRNPKGVVPGVRWYADNTREGIRDDTLREGLVAIGAVIERSGVPTTSSKPRYALTADFADLFNPALEGDALTQTIAAWQGKALNAGALARLAINRQGAGKAGDRVLVTFPNNETRLMKPGESFRRGPLIVRTVDLSGHYTPSLGYLVDGLSVPVLVTGDALFAGSMGGCDTPSLYQHALARLKDVLTSLPDSTVLLPGHGPATTLGEERSGNPFL